MKKSLLIFATLFCFFLLPHSAQAALQFVGSASATGNSASFNVGLTSLTGGVGSTALEGDLVIVINGHATANTDTDPGVSTSGYTEVADLFQTDTNGANLSANYKIMSASPDTTVSCNGSGTATNGAVCIAYVWRGVNPVTPLDVTSTTAQSASADAPDCASITPTTAGAYVICSGLGASSAVDTSVTAPSGYSNATSTSVDPGVAPTMGIVSKAWTSGAEDPAAWTTWSAGTTAQNSWAAVTMALRPITAPTVATLDAINITSISATLKGTILNIGSASISQYGFASSTVSTLSSSVSTTTTNSRGAGEHFITAITGLSADTTYYYRAYAANGDNGYGSIASFATRPATIERTLRLFEGQRIKLVSGRLVLNQSSPIIAVSSGASGPQTIYLTANSDGTCGSGCWTVPTDWSNVDNTIEAIGEGGNGAAGNTSTYGGGGGGGGAYAKISNLSLIPGASITFAIGTGGTKTKTQFKDSSTLVADYGSTTVTTYGAYGGQTANSVGDTKYAGGKGGGGLLGPAATPHPGGGGGGAGGPNGAGANSATTTAGAGTGGGGGGGGTAGSADSGTTGGNGGDNYLGAGHGAGSASGSAGVAGTAGGGGGGSGSDTGAGHGNKSGGAGGAGTDWNATHGSGGGGGGGGDGDGADTGNPGGAGGNYGAGGGGGSSNINTPGAGGAGAPGIIVITYTPPTEVFLAANSDGTCGSGCWTVPSNFSTTHNSVEVIGGGGGGSGAVFTGGPGTKAAGAGGGGGAYSKVTLLSISGSITFQIGAGGGGGPATTDGTAGGDTWFNGATCAGSSVCAKGGGLGAASGGGTALHGSGGLASGGVGTGFNGGDGADGVLSSIHDGGAGGGAGGPAGAGAAASSATGGTGGNSSGGAGGTVGANAGGNGTEFDTTHGSGGGGGGGSSTGPTAGGAGGNYGGGGGGGGVNSATAAGAAGIGGIIVITYTAQ